MASRRPDRPILDPAGDDLSTLKSSRSRKGARRLGASLLVFAGPGLISASAGNDAGGIATYASAGSQFAYRTLFFMVIVTFAYVAVQEMTALASMSGNNRCSFFSRRLVFSGVRASRFSVSAKSSSSPPQSTRSSAVARRYR